MDILRFTLSGKQAFFKNPDVNAYNYYTFGHIHKVALMGMFGAMLGYGGYNQMKKEDDFPEFYKKLKDIRVAIVPVCNKGRFNKKIIEFNNSVGYASAEQGGNLIVRQQWLEEPEWNIYLELKDEESKKIANAVLNRNFIYVPYLGSNNHMADITNAKIIAGKIIDLPEHINSLCIKKYVMMDIDDDDYETENFKYEEILPVSMDKDLNMYQCERFIYSDMKVVTCEQKVYEVKDDNYKKDGGVINLAFF